MSLAKTSILSGLFRFQGGSDASEEHGKLFLVYSILFSTALVYFFTVNFYFILTVDMFNTSAIGVASAFFFCTFDSIYFMVQSSRIRSLLNDFHLLTKAITESYLSKTDDIIFHRVLKLNCFLKIFITLYLSLPVTTGLFIYLCHLMLSLIHI